MEGRVLERVPLPGVTMMVVETPRTAKSLAMLMRGINMWPGAIKGKKKTRRGDGALVLCSMALME